MSDRVKWTAGYVVAWVEDEEFQKKTRAFILEKVAAEKPDIILAHSLGSLISYNAFSHPDAGAAGISSVLNKCNYITLGSQIGNPFVVRNLTPGRIEPLDVGYWYHLYNEEDDVFTAEIRLFGADNFKQVNTPFDIPGFADHSATSYFKQSATVSDVWGRIAEQTVTPRPRALRPAVTAARTGKAVVRAPRRLKYRALLVGINDYPEDSDKLEGCINDVYQMSAVLQECGFPPDSIRVCLDSRATARGIMERLQWLIDDPREGDQRIFYYSGHGASIPEYGDGNEPDRLCESLVPYDFDWSPETAITDDQIFSIYSQLPYELRLAMIFDCCHSGGMHRDGGRKIKAIQPPDDIRHRTLKWDTETGMWVSRDFKRLNKNFSSDTEVNKKFFGKNGATSRLGRASLLRGQDERTYKSMTKTGSGKNLGPYLPMIIEACREEEYSYEYRHGVTSYGAFTYSLEPGTPAERLEGHLPEDVKSSRRDELMAVQQKIAFEFGESLVGYELDALIDAEVEPGVWIGRTQHGERDRVS